MAPIYNPPASASATGADEQYFTDLGLLTGLSKLIDITGGNTFLTPDETYGTAAVITNNLLKWGAASASSWVGYNIGTMSKVLMMGYTTCSTSQLQYYFICKELADNSNEYIGQDSYFGANSPASPASEIWKRVGGTFTTMASDATIFGGKTAFPVVSDPAYGWALYVTDSVQKYFLKFGSTGNWMPIFSETDANTTSFKSVALWTLAKNQRITSPFTVWGA